MHLLQNLTASSLSVRLILMALTDHLKDLDKEKIKNKNFTDHKVTV